MKKHDVLVSAELAKEKLARILDDVAKSRRCMVDIFCAAHCSCGLAEKAIAQLIRNTDLTDCQQEDDEREVGKAFLEALRKHDPEYCWSQCPTEWVVDQINKFADAGLISPAPDQGSVRTELETAFRAAVELIKVWHNFGGADNVWQLYYDNAPEMKLIREAIRALPVLEDQKD